MASLDHAANSLNNQVMVEEHKVARIIVLNRPKQLNALSDYVASRLLELFLAYEEDPCVKLILLKGKGRAFCVGGDVPAVAQAFSKDWRFGANFFGKMYSLNYVMATCRKTQVSFLNGFVMGGGAGVSMHGRFRIATENTVFAMPEAVIGGFPDVGASYFLSRLPGFLGEYLGLTGARLNGAEMVACGLATHFVPYEKLPLLEEELCKTVSNDPLTISKIIFRYEEQPALKENSVYFQLRTIDKCFSRETVEDILSSLEIESAKNNARWISAAIQSLKKGSPISLKIFLRSIREGRLQGVGQCLVREYRMICHAVRAELSRDIFEGYRATFVDKDKNPKWEPSRLELVTDSMVDHYFSRVDDKDWEDLKFPVRSKSPQLAMARM